MAVVDHRPPPVGRAARRRCASRASLGRLAVAAVLLTANWTGYVWAVANDRVLETALGYFMAPLATMVLGITVLGEPASRLHRVALGLAAAAVVVLTISYGRPPWIALVIAASWSLYGLLKRQVPLDPVESLAGETFLLLVPAVVLVVVMAGRADSIPSTATAGDWMLVALTGVVTAVPLLLFAFAAQRVPFTLLGALQYLVPTINLFLGWLVYDESMPPVRLAGFVLVWIALLVITVDQRPGTAASARCDRRLAPCRRPPVSSLDGSCRPARRLAAPSSRARAVAVAALAAVRWRAIGRRLRAAARGLHRGRLDGQAERAGL